MHYRTAGIRRRVATGLALAAPLAASSACTPEVDLPDPKTLPYRLVPEKVYGTPVVGTDMTGDGRDELIDTWNPNQVEPGRMTALVLKSLEGVIVDQVNFEGRVLEPRFLDVDGDRRPEILAPVLRNDSLFLNVVDSDGKKRFAFPLTHGAPRNEPEGSLPWDPRVVDFHLVDSDRDGRDDLVTVVATGYARSPRGVLVHRIPDGEPIGQAFVGAQIYGSFLQDVDADGDPEVLVQTAATHNGAEAGGFDDSRLYLMSFDVVGTVSIGWHRPFPPGVGYSHTHMADLDGDGSDEIVMVTWSDSRGTRLEVLRPGSWEALARAQIPEPVEWVRLTDLDHDALPDIVASYGAEEVVVMGPDLRVSRRGRVPGRGIIHLQPDLDGDLVDEIVVQVPRGVVLLDPDLRAKAVYRWDDGQGDWRSPGPSLLRRGFGNPPHLLLRRTSGTLQLSMHPNPMFVVHRYGAPVAGSLGAALLLVAGMRARRRRREVRLVQAVRRALLARTGALCLVSDAAGTIHWTSGGLARLLEASRLSPRNPDLEDLEAVAPGLPAAVRRALGRRSPGTERGECSLVSEDGTVTTAVAVVEPLIVGDDGDPHVLVHLESCGARFDAEAAVTWGLLSRRVAHDLKNPLTTMLLTVQRMQMEYRERAPELARDLDGYTRRIENRVEDLRRLASNFVKLVSVEEASPRPLDVNALVRGFGDRFGRDLPDDVGLRTCTTPDLPPVSADPEQIESVLQNLATNAVHAMPDGGVLTIRTDMASDVQGRGSDSPSHFVTLEIMDTGAGMTAETLDRIFRPGYTTREDGWGLGLAMVRKVVEDHGGRVVVESEPDVGTAVTVLLPVAGDQG